ncbi:MAG TPA: hypothetical protein PLB63_00710 [Planctomycetota bacterium]|nr:hypothetical protein [Planctomycetota bacterium]HQA99541.1 hypothetical protein [Planctomycetota bacterium]
MSDERKSPKLLQPQPSKVKHRLLVKPPEEMGLTARIKKALVQQDMGITQRIKRAMDKTRDEQSFFYMKKNHFIMIGILLVLLFIFGYLAFRTRELTLHFAFPNGDTSSETIAVNILDFSKQLQLSDYPRQVHFFRNDIYGNDLTKKDYKVTDKDGKEVENATNLLPGTYNLVIQKDGFKEQKKPINISKVQVEVPVTLEPIVEHRRELKLYINDPMIEGYDLEPDDIRIVKNNKSIKNIQVKAGTYGVIIEKAGYHSKEMELNIPENGIIREKVTLDYKKRSLKFLVDDGLAEKGYEKTVGLNEIELFQEGKKIEFKEALTPGYYDLHINRDGYYEYKNKIKVMAGADLCTMYIPLKTKAREVVVIPNYDIVPASYKPDKAYLSDVRGSEKEIIPLTEGLRVPPGRYWVRVEKANYHPYSKEVEITPATAAFEIKAHLISVSKLIMLKITSDFEVDSNINPDELLFDMKISKVGYKGLNWGNQRSLPPEKKEIEVPVFLETIPRKVICEITSDIVPGPIKADTITFRRILEGREEGQTIDLNKQGVEVKPARYMLQIKKYGYEDIREEQIVYPAGEQSPFIIRKEMKALARSLMIKLDTNYEPGVPVTADEMRLDNNLAESGIKIKPKTYTLFLRKSGYQNLEKIIKIEPGHEPYVVQEQLIAKPRELRYDIKGDNLAKIYPDTVTFDGNAVKENTSIPAKKDYEVQIHKKGYAIFKKAISVEPSDHPFVLDEILSPLKRTVHLVLEASFPKGKDLMPPETATLSSEKAASISIVQDIDVTPGRYNLTIIKTGYKSINDIVEIEPDDVAYRIQRIMQPKERDVQTEITYDIAPEEKTDPIIRIESEDGTINQIVKPGDKIIPNKYKVTIEADGYRPLIEDLVVPPAETAYTFKHTLNAKPRTVILDITADYPPGQKITPDKVLMNGELFSEGMVSMSKQMAPGRYSTLIEKAGYNTIQKENVIPAGTKDYIIKEQMITLPRLVTYHFFDSEKKDKELTPDQITLGTEIIGQNSSFKPGNYRLFVRIQGYPDIIEDHEIEPGVTPYHITKGLIPSTRILNYEITGDYNTEFLTPTEITLNGIPFTNGASFAPGSYDLTVYVPGYERVVKRVEFGANPNPFMIREKLISKPRKVVFDISANYPKGVVIRPNQVTFNDKSLLDGEPVKPILGGYQVRVIKEGYLVEPKNVIIEPSEDVFTLKSQLNVRPRNLQFKLTGNYKVGEEIKADAIVVNNNEYHPSDVFTPGSHKIKINKAGYKPLIFDHTMDPGEHPDVVKKTMEALPRQCEIKVKSLFTQEIEEVEIAEIGGRPFYENPYTPGTYDVYISHPGYYDVRSKVEVTPGVETLILNYEIAPKKRVIIPAITYDCEPLPNSEEPQIRLIASETSESLRIQRGDELTPGYYRLKVEKPGYETYETERLIILPDERPFELAVEMQALIIEILIDISYDITPPAKLAPYIVTFIDKKTGIGRNVSHGNKIKPGSYYLQVGRIGYEFKEGRKEIEVLPGTKPHQVTEKLFAKYRPLSFEMTFNTVLIKAIEVLLDGKQVKAQDTFKPGQQYQLTAKFQEYQTADKMIEIEPGEGPFVVDLKLIKLHKYEFRVAKQYYETEFGMVIDNIRYNLEVFVDGKEVERHHILREGGMSSIYGYYYALNSSRNVRIASGFYYDDTIASMTKPAIFRDLTQINCDKLVEHLRELAKTNPSTALKRMNNLMNDIQDKHKVANLASEDKAKLKDTLQDLDIRDKKQQEIRSELVKRLTN